MVQALAQRPFAGAAVASAVSALLELAVCGWPTMVRNEFLRIALPIASPASTLPPGEWRTTSAPGLTPAVARKVSKPFALSSRILVSSFEVGELIVPVA